MKFITHVFYIKDTVKLKPTTYLPQSLYSSNRNEDFLSSAPISAQPWISTMGIDFAKSLGRITACSNLAIRDNLWPSYANTKRVSIVFADII